MHNRRDVQRQLNHPPDIYGEAWESLTNPVRIVKENGSPLSLVSWSDCKERASASEEGTDIPTTDTTDAPA